MFNFFQQHANAFFILSGVLIGDIITIIGNWIMLERESKNKRKEFFLNKKHEAIESILEVTHNLQLTGMAYGEETDFERRCPIIMVNNDELDKFHIKISTISMKHHFWLPVSVNDELQYMQSYFANLQHNLGEIGASRCSELGVMIRDDFLALGGSLSDILKESYSEDFHLIEKSSVKKDFAENQTKRLKLTDLFVKHDEILSIRDN